MTTQRMRTPRRRKIWAGYNQLISVTGSPPAQADILDQTMTDLGLSNLAGVTVMRVVGQATLRQQAAASTSAHVRVNLGFTWQDSLIAAASAGSGFIPSPWHHGSRETNWIQQGMIEGTEKTTVVVFEPAAPVEQSTWRFDITQMSKQRNADQRLMFIYDWVDLGTPETAKFYVNLTLQVLLALP